MRKQTQVLKTGPCGILAAAALVMATALPVGAASVWSPETVLSAPGAANWSPSIATNSSGVSIVAWNQQTGTPAVNAVDASIRTASGWSSATALTDGSANASVAGVAVDPKGNAVVFYNEGAAGTLLDRRWTVAGWSAPEAAPGGPGFTVFSGAGFDAYGNLEIAVSSPHPAGRYVAYDVEVIVRTSAGSWRASTLLTNGFQVGGARLFVNRAGQGFVDSGFTVWRSESMGTWGSAVNIAKQNYGQVFGLAAGFDAGGHAYIAFSSHYLGPFIATSAPGTGWMGPSSLSRISALGSNLNLAGSSDGHAIIYGTDGSVARATATTDGGKTWGPLRVLPGSAGATGVDAAGDNGLFTLIWSNGPYVQTSSGDATHWPTPTRLAGGYGFGVTAMAGSTAAGAWIRLVPGSGTNQIVGAATATVTP